MNNDLQEASRQLQESLNQSQRAAEHAAALGLLFILVMYGLLFLNLILMLLSLIKCVRSQDPEKTMWVLIIIFVPVVGWIMYRIMRKRPDDEIPAIPNRPRSASSSTGKTTFTPPPTAKSEKAVADAVQASMDEMLRQKRAAQRR